MLWQDGKSPGGSTYFAALIGGLDSRPDNSSRTRRSRTSGRHVPQRHADTGEVEAELDLATEAGVTESWIGADDGHVGHGGDEMANDHLQEQLSRELVCPAERGAQGR